MFGRLPETIDPIQLAEQGARLTGELPLQAMTRLAAACEVCEGMATADLKFAREPHGLRFLRARIEAKLGLLCQRCLLPMDVIVRSEPVLALFRPGEPQTGVPEEAEPLVVEPGWSLAALVEDELLLAMPMMPRHAAGECEAGTRLAPKTPRVEVKTDRPNPFAVLEKLRKRD
ncbi:MAG: hypothetical protein A2V58_09580 [Candidatus Muproteobacteria bacterium RBG_19FT_COMBO_61_10]|uniref:Large ribosomal RNA subunit accumulation protein YceD n=1 Tax=Candidatus Muproteobacteria bacterium RBG_19FT_COMBO_61_10 TaxID=1817761 RepID=A0A1F6UM24_9PROT|nr:MAG: hypothetical protein A2V58_09580 [Candidatus Muproteobacteria bacterium RBG_19FT_COMBO_61_10]